MKSKIDKDRLYWIDAIRSFACLCVITTHAPMPGFKNGLAWIAVFNFFSVAGASILFFMISGALVLFKPKPVVPFLKKRMSRIVFPMVFWTIVTLLVSVMLDGMGWPEFFKHVAKIPFIPQVGTYWFIYVIFGIYLVTPIMATWLERCSQSDLQLYLGLWAITLLIPYYQPLHVMVEYAHGYLYQFYGFLWFAVMGYYIRRYVDIPKFQWWHILLFICLLILPGVLYCTPMSHGVIQNRMALHVVALCVCYFVILKHINYSDKMKQICYNFAQHSFGIYLVHYLVIHQMMWPLLSRVDINYAFQIPLTVFLTALCSYLIVKLLSYLPYSKYIVGV